SIAFLSPKRAIKINLDLKSGQLRIGI
ncbi:MAG: hypothetical protein RI918_2281, partial [Pseudomonadota bacterium]